MSYPDKMISLKRLVFDALNSLLADPATKRPTWLLGTMPPLVAIPFALEPLLRSAMRLARNLCTGDEAAILYIHTRTQGATLILQIDERPAPNAEGKCLVSIALGQVP